MTTIPTGAVPVLDKGYVALVRLSHEVRYTPEGGVTLAPSSEVGVVADARVSTAKTAEQMGPSEARTLRFLLREDHTSPLRGQVVTFEVRAPLFVARQWWKYVVGSDHDESAIRDPFLSWNEESRRYVEEEPEFYVPSVWRTAPEKRSQGSGGEHPKSRILYLGLHTAIRDGTTRYQQAITDGVAPEQARLFLPAYAMYTRWRWTSSLQGVGHFLSQRLAHDAQSEIREYAEAVRGIVEDIWPTAIPSISAPKGEK